MKDQPAGRIPCHHQRVSVPYSVHLFNKHKNIKRPCCHLILILYLCNTKLRTMILSKSTEYAIRALIFVQMQNIADKRPGVSEIAKGIEAPMAFSAKILNLLTTHRLLYSLKGKGGGFYFPDNHTELTMYDVILAIEGAGIFTECAIGLKSCSDKNPCPIHNEYEKVREQFLMMSKKQTIYSMAQKTVNGDAVLNRLNASLS